MRAFTIRPDQVLDGIAVTVDPLDTGRAVLLDKYKLVFMTVDEQTFGGIVSRVFRVQISDSKILIHDPGIMDKRALLFFDIQKMFRGSIGYGIKERSSEGGFAPFLSAQHLIHVLKQTDGSAPKYLAIVQPDTVIHVRRFRGRALKEDFYLWWNGCYPKISTNEQEIFGPSPFSRFLPEQYKNVL